jgi:hypothetical protein
VDRDAERRPDRLPPPLGPEAGHRELYVVLRGRAEFTLDERVDAGRPFAVSGWEADWAASREPTG